MHDFTLIMKKTLLNDSADGAVRGNEILRGNEIYLFLTAITCSHAVA